MEILPYEVKKTILIDAVFVDITGVKKKLPNYKGGLRCSTETFASFLT